MVAAVGSSIQLVRSSDQTYNSRMERRRCTEGKTGIPDHTEEDQDLETEVFIHIQPDQEQEASYQHIVDDTEEDTQQFYDVDQPEEDIEIECSKDGEPVISQPLLKMVMKNLLETFTKSMEVMQQQMVTTLNEVVSTLHNIKNININNHPTLEKRNESTYGHTAELDKEVPVTDDASCPLEGNHTPLHRHEDNRMYCHSNRPVTGKSRRDRKVDVPPFNGRDNWTVWINRFEAIAVRQQWSDDDKLDRLLPKLQGEAGEFAFTQLPKQVLSNYNVLIDELHSRFRKIETPKIFATLFSRRNQSNDESVEEYAITLKQLYDKGHGYRDHRVRQEDLVRRFLDGLLDDDARFEVEFHKDPSTIDVAVYQVVLFQQTKHRFKSDLNCQGNEEKNVRKHSRCTTNLHTSSDQRESRCDREEVHFNQLRRVSSIGPRKTAKRQCLKGNSCAQIKPAPSTASDGSPIVLQPIFDRMEKSTDVNYRLRRKARRKKCLVCHTCRCPGHFSRDCTSQANTITASTEMKTRIDRDPSVSGLFGQRLM